VATPLEVFLQGRDQTLQAFRSLSSNLDKVRQGTAGLMARWRDLTIVATGVVRVARQISRTFSETIHAAERQVNAEVKLAAALRGTGGQLSDNIQRLREFASQRQAVTTFGDEVTLELATIGAEFGLTVDQIEKAVVAVQDRSLALGRGPLELMRVVARFGGGVADSLIDVGVVVDKTADRAQEFNRAMAAMTSGMSELVGSLPTSALSKLENTFGDLQEGIGKVISSTGTFQALVRTVEGWVQDLNEALDNRETLETVRKAIDDFVIGAVGVFRFLAAGVLTTVADVLDALGALVGGLQAFGLISGPEDLERQMRSLRDTMATLDPAIEKDAAALERLTGEMDDLRGQHQRVIRSTQISGDAFRQAALTVTGWTEDIEAAIDSSQSWIDSQGDVFEAIQKANEAMREQRDRVAGASEVEGPQFGLGSADFSGFMEGLQQQIEDGAPELIAAGDRIGTDLQIAIADAFDREVGLQEAMDDLGKRLKFTFIDNFSEAALSPIKASFGAIATAAAQPFAVVGQFVNKVLLAPITAFVSTALTALAGEMAIALGLQASVAATSVALAAGLAVAWAPAAAAASIATLGSALAFGPATIAAMKAVKAAALASFVGLAEGGVVMPRPGGTPAILGEAGKPEAVIPLDRNLSPPAFAALSAAVSWFTDLASQGLPGGQVIEATRTITESSTIPRLRDGAIVMPRPGGTPAILGEGGHAEAVIPLDDAGGRGLGNVTHNHNWDLRGSTFGGSPGQAMRDWEDRVQFLMRGLHVPRIRGSLI